MFICIFHDNTFNSKLPVVEIKLNRFISIVQYGALEYNVYISYNICIC